MEKNNPISSEKFTKIEGSQSDSELNEPRMLTLRRPSPEYMQWLMWLSIFGYAAGVVSGIAGRVATACIILGISTMGVTIIRFLRSLKRRKIEFFVPAGISVALIVVALTLPHAR